MVQIKAPYDAYDDVYDDAYDDVSEMEKRVDSADVSVLFFSSAVLSFRLLMRKKTINTVLFWTVQKTISYKHCAMSAMILALCYWLCAISTWFKFKGI